MIYVPLLTPLDKMWISFVGIGLMAIAAVLITVARIYIPNWLEKRGLASHPLFKLMLLLLKLIALICLILGALLSYISVA